MVNPVQPENNEDGILSKDDADLALKMEMMAEKAMNSLYFMNKEMYKEEAVRRWIYILTGEEPDPSLKVFTPFYTDFGKNLHLNVQVAEPKHKI